MSTCWRGLVLWWVLIGCVGCGQVAVAVLLLSDGGGAGSGGGGAGGAGNGGSPDVGGPVGPVEVQLNVVEGPASGGTVVGVAILSTQVTAEPGNTGIQVDGVTLDEVEVLSGSQLRFSMPANPAGNRSGSARVVVSIRGVRALDAFFDYRALPPEISDISPSELDATTGGTLTVTGSGFVAGVAVRVGGIPLSEVEVLDESTLTCVVPVRANGGYDVEVIHPEGLVARRVGGVRLVLIPPEEPRDLRFETVTFDSVRLEWEDRSEVEDGFLIARRLEGTVAFVTVGTTGPNETSFLDEGLSPETEYTYAVVAVRNEVRSLPLRRDYTAPIESRLVFLDDPSRGFQVEDVRGSRFVTVLSRAEELLRGVGVSSVGTGSYALINFTDPDIAPFGTRFQGDVPFPGDTPENDEHFAVRVRGTVWIPSAGDWSFGTNADDGVSLRLDGVELIRDDSTHPPEDRFGSRILSRGAHALELIYFNGINQAHLELFAKPGVDTTFDSDFVLVGDVASGGIGFPAIASATPIASPVRVAIVDARGQVVPGSSDAITIRDERGGLLGTTTVQAVDGVATFSDLQIPLAGTSRLSATAPLRGSARTQPFRVEDVSPSRVASARPVEGEPQLFASLTARSRDLDAPEGGFEATAQGHRRLSGDGLRCVRTVDGGFGRGDFDYALSLEVPASLTGDAFVGLGVGLPDQRRLDWPLAQVALRLRGVAEGVSLSVLEGQAETSLGLVEPGRHRVRWRSRGGQLRVEVGRRVGGSFQVGWTHVCRASAADVLGPGVHLFFGAASPEVSFVDLTVR